MLTIGIASNSEVKDIIPVSNIVNISIYPSKLQDNIWTLAVNVGPEVSNNKTEIYLIVLPF